MPEDARAAATLPGQANGTPSPGMAVGPAIAPLNVTGLLVTKADLVAALRLYLPQLADLEVLPDGRFVLHLAPATATASGG